MVTIVILIPLTAFTVVYDFMFQSYIGLLSVTICVNAALKYMSTDYKTIDRKINMQQDLPTLVSIMILIVRAQDYKYRREKVRSISCTRT